MPARKPVNPSLTSIVGKCEGATGSLAIVASDRAPSHPCGITPRIAIANDAPRGAASW